jgi:hypothetical protein
MNNNIIQRITINSETSKTYTTDISVIAGDRIKISIVPSYYYKSSSIGNWRFAAWTVSSVKVLGTIIEGNINPHMT